jgi:hypothetical protein
MNRSAEKDTFPSKWDVSVGGHLSAGDAVIETALRLSMLPTLFSVLFPLFSFNLKQDHQATLFERYVLLGGFGESL